MNTLVKIRLRRMGAKGQPSYRIVVADSRSPRDGRFIEIVGNYNPRTDPPTVNVNRARVEEWMAKGAQPSDSVYKLLARSGIVEYRPFPVSSAKPAATPAAE
jgi:small subunit ribosomal protein S16